MGQPARSSGCIRCWPSRAKSCTEASGRSLAIGVAVGGRTRRRPGSPGACCRTVWATADDRTRRKPMLLVPGTSELLAALALVAVPRTAQFGSLMALAALAGASAWSASRASTIYEAARRWRPPSAMMHEDPAIAITFIVTAATLHRRPRSDWWPTWRGPTGRSGSYQSESAWCPAFIGSGAKSTSRGIGSRHERMGLLHPTRRARISARPR